MAPKGTILVVASSQATMEMKDKSQHDVGFYLNELAVPTEYLADHDYRIVLATPSGEKPLMDASSNDKKFFNNDDAARAKAVQFVDNLPVISLKEAGKHLDNYQALFVPGGHAPMTDLMQDPQLGAAFAISTSRTSDSLYLPRPGCRPGRPAQRSGLSPSLSKRRFFSSPESRS